MEKMGMRRGRITKIIQQNPTIAYRDILTQYNQIHQDDKLLSCGYINKAIREIKESIMTDNTSSPDANVRIQRFRKLLQEMPNAASGADLIRAYNEKYKDDNFKSTIYGYTYLKRAGWKAAPDYHKIGRIKSQPTLVKKNQKDIAHISNFLPVDAAQRANRIHVLAKTVGGYEHLEEIVSAINEFGSTDRFLKAVQALKQIREILDTNQ